MKCWTLFLPQIRNKNSFHSNFFNVGKKSKLESDSIEEGWQTDFISKASSV